MPVSAGQPPVSKSPRSIRSETRRKKKPQEQTNSLQSCGFVFAGGFEDELAERGGFEPGTPVFLLFLPHLWREMGGVRRVHVAPSCAILRHFQPILYHDRITPF